ncbi:hypothetical protein HO133_004039 [Letharia lupina]|uniref:ML-like domain-containing protein n=1 Tax=Letharia lupina TaxID=560253 RepID=A0A8H6C9L9_9LECA|nr:uncharacterized protein HO133_004039 [Letharia lupina]KAF6219570.1 hypothetical protein HO133_004039 [Letharia lupina]
MSPPHSTLSGRSWSAVLLLIVSFLSLIDLTLTNDNLWIQTTNSAGETIWLRDDRKPALYTQDFGDCLGGSLINVTRFDAAYYQDNMTVLFHLEGNTNVANESIMMYIGVFAYGESRFDLTFNPCNAQIYSLCPMNSSVPISADGIIPVDQSDVSGIPAIALGIPDFEGQAILRIFGNSTETEIGCYSALVTNGASFSHPSSVGTVLGIFTIVAIVASLATAVYGDHIPTMRTHYAHSLSVFVVFAVLHHIYFTGALSMNWPSVLAAFWSNFAWSAGMIYSESMQNSINQLIGSNKGNTSIVGAASSGASANDLGGGYSISQIYKRASLDISRRYLESLDHQWNMLRTRELESHIAKRAASNSSSASPWYGNPIKPGLPIPGNFSGFAGTLSEQGIPASNAFMTGLLWLLILIALITASVVAFKWILEGLGKANLVKTERLAHFRDHWLLYAAQAALRTMFTAFFMMIFLTLFELTYKGSAGVTAIAALVFTVFFVSMLGIAGYACFYRLRLGRYETVPDRVHFQKIKAIGPIPWYGLKLESHRFEKSEPTVSAGSVPWWRIRFVNEDPQRVGVHQDKDYTMRFGWLAARFRRTRWWFFVVWLVYEFVRACFYGGAAGHALTQVFGLLVVEIIALVVIVLMRPFEGARLNALMVYLLGFSKVATVALSAAFDARFNLQRITTTAIGIVIIVIQGVLAIVLMIAIVIGAISSYMSLTRNHENFKPQKLEKIRQRYFAHLEKTAPDVPPPPPPPPPPPEEPKGPYFNVTSVRREPKIEDEDENYIGSIHNPLGSRVSVARPATARASRANSMRSQLESPYTNAPFGARVHRASWSSRDFNAHYDPSNNKDSALDYSTRSSRIWSSSGIETKASDGSLRESSSRRVKTPLNNGEGGLEVRKRYGKERDDVLTEERHSEEQLDPRD